MIWLQRLSAAALGAGSLSAGQTARASRHNSAPLWKSRSVQATPRLGPETAINISAWFRCEARQDTFKEEQTELESQQHQDEAVVFAVCAE